MPEIDGRVQVNVGLRRRGSGWGLPLALGVTLDILIGRMRLDWSLIL